MSLTLYKGFYQQCVGLYYKGSDQPEKRVASLLFESQDIAVIGGGFTVYGSETPETANICYNGLGRSWGLSIPDSGDTVHMFALLCNNGEITGVKDFNGVLLTPWYDVDMSETPVLGVSTFYYLSQDGNRYKINLDHKARIKGIYDNRYLIIDSPKRENAYDIVTGKWHCWCSSYNNELLLKFADIPANTGYNATTLDASSQGRDFIIFAASGVNNHYEVTGNIFAGSQWPVERLYGAYGNISVKIKAKS